MDFGKGIGEGKSTSGAGDSQHAPVPKKYNPALVSPSIERINRLYGYTIAVAATGDRQKKEFGVGTLGLLIQILAIAVLCVLPLWMGYTERTYLAIFSTSVSFMIVLVVCAVTSFMMLSAGHALSKKYLFRHHGANLACGIFTHIVPVQIVIALLFVPLTLLNAI